MRAGKAASAPPGAPIRKNTRCGPAVLQDVAPIRDWRQVTIVLTASALLLALLNLAAARFAQPSERWNRGEFIIDTKWRLASAGTPADLVFLGDSTCLVSLDPAHLPADAGLAVNLCTVGDVLPLADLYLLERHVRHAGAPRAIVVMHAYDIYSRQLSLENFMLLPFGPFEAARRAATLPGFLPHQQIAFGVRSVFEKLFPLYGRRAQLRAELGVAPRRQYRHVPISALGYMPTVKTSATEVEDDAVFHRRSAQQHPDYQLTSYGQYTIDRLGRLAEHEGFTVYLVPSPLYRGLREDPAFGLIYQQYLTQLKAVAAARPCVVPMLDQEWLFDASEMQNADHILPEHAPAFTARLAAAIAAAPTPCR